MWFDVGSPQELIRAQRVLIERRDELPFPLPQGAHIERGSFIHPDARVANGAVVEESVIAQHATVGKDAVLKHCVLMNGSRVEQGVQLTDCILSPGAVIAANVSTSNVILGDNEHLENV